MDDFEVSMRRANSRRRAISAVVLITALTASCTVRPPPTPTTPATPGDVPLIALEQPPALTDDGNRAALKLAIERSLAYYDRRSVDEILRFGPDEITVGSMRTSLAALLPLLAPDATDGEWLTALEDRFTFYRAPTTDGALFTGYYVPTIEARLSSDDEFRYPIHGRPRDLVTLAPALVENVACRRDIVGRVEGGRLVPYYTRAEIEGSNPAQAPIIAWTRDPVDLFFLQIQGSGTIELPDGSRKTVGYAATNGHPYVSIGRLLLQRGELAPGQASQANIRAWVAEDPDTRSALLHENPRYVFFRLLDRPPEGSLGVAVTGGRSIATDETLYPAGALAFIRLPGKGDAPDLARLVLNQDAGGAIRGRGRVDLFFGAGDAAGIAAGRIKTRGELYFLAPRLEAGDERTR